MFFSLDGIYLDLMATLLLQVVAPSRRRNVEMKFSVVFRMESPR